MQLTCPHCQAAWDFSDRRPAFCPFCGKSLPPQGATLPYAPPQAAGSEAATVAADRPAPAGAAADPEAVGGYRLVRVLGVGGMGKVYEAEDAATGRRVALKLVSADYAGSAAAVERFRQEGQLASRIAHPRCVFVVAADEDAGRPYIVMELMPGDTLFDHIRHWKALPPGKAVALILDVMEGLREAHRVGVVHRDVKPSNCFFGHDGRLKVGDFGLAKSLAQGAHLTKTGSFLGTPLYASPEQVRGEPLDAQTDVYSVAATLYFMLTGRAPFQSDNPVTTLARIAADPVPPMRSLKPELPLELDEAVLRGLERDRKRRWRTIEEFAEALRPFLPGKASEAGLVVRVGALALDLALFYALDYPLAWLVESAGLTRIAAGFGARVNDLLPLANPLLLLLYFAFTEGFGGCSPGKRLLGLRVRNAASGDPARLGPVLARAALFTLFFYLSTVLTAGTLVLLAQPRSSFGLHDFAARVGDYPLLTAVPEFGFFLGLVLLICTMRSRNGYRGLHEVLSGTRVVRLPRADRRGSLAHAAARKPSTPVPVASDSVTTRPAGLPDKMGAFAIRGALTWTDRARVLAGFDAALGRPAVLWLRPASEPPLPAERRELDRTTRLRWLAAGQAAEYRWDAFLAPDGGPLSAVVDADRRTPWPRFQPRLNQLTDELRQGLREKTLPDQLGPELVWVRPDDSVILLDFPLNDSPAPLTARAGDPEKQALALLARVAVSALEGQPPPAELPPAMRVPLPGPVATVLRTLLAHERTGLPLRVFHKRLRALQDIPGEVTRRRRAVQVAVAAALVILTFGCFTPVLLSSSHVARQMQVFQEIDAGAKGMHDLDDAAVADYLRFATSPNPFVRACAAVSSGRDALLREELRQAVDERRNRVAEQRKLNLPPAVNTFGVSQVWAVSPQFYFPHSLSIREPPEVLRARAAQAADRLKQKNEWGLLWLVGNVLCLALGPAAWVLATLALRRGLSYVVAGIDLVRPDGTPAGRWRCAGRALLVWAPFALLLMLSHGLNDWCWEHWDGRAPAPAVLPAVASSLCLAAWLLLPVYALLSVIFTRRGVQDYLAGTYPVPR